MRARVDLFLSQDGFFKQGSINLTLVSAMQGSCVRGWRWIVQTGTICFNLAWGFDEINTPKLTTCSALAINASKCGWAQRSRKEAVEGQERGRNGVGEKKATVEIRKSAHDCLEAPQLMPLRVWNLKLIYQVASG